MELEGKVALITGASKGIGKETAILLASYGAKVAICARHLQECENVAEFIQNTYGTKAIGVSCDVANEEEVEAVVEKVREQLGTVDILINNAGAMLLKPFTETSTYEWQRMFDVNVHGPYYFCKQVVKEMKQKNDGVIVNISSIWGTKGGPDRSAYITSKHAVIGFSKALGEELKPYGVRVNAVCPGPVDTQMTAALGENINKAGWLHPIDIAYVIVDLVLPKSKAISATSVEAFGAGMPVGITK
ncbi:SDR family NAD(P)-dependent oxidoreductase [Peribacillus sp. NPDC097295]|uniref:SDR family NAD(P)-dependent oxidoreductase n=1 Tax=Peribacillus sp. NPDC097295 TaxID=3364402 RepID=UPI0038269C1C